MNNGSRVPGNDSILVDGAFQVTPERVFRAWTDPDEVKKWFGSAPGALAAATIDLRPGGRWRFSETASTAGSVGFEGHYIEIEHNKVLVFSWSKFIEHPDRERWTTPASRVEVRFVPTSEGTHMTIVHAAIDDVGIRNDFAAGWQRALPNLARAVISS